MCLAFGVEKLDDLADKLGEILELQPPQGLVDKVRSLGKLKSIADSMPKEVSKAACQEVVLTGDDVESRPASRSSAAGRSTRRRSSRSRR